MALHDRGIPDQQAAALAVIAPGPESILIAPEAWDARRRRITIAILALGGQGGGVLTQWIIQLGRSGAFRAQSTSVPGVAQRTGSTIYYVEIVPWREGEPEPIPSLTPAPGDVDVVIAAELMEAGRAIQRGASLPKEPHSSPLRIASTRSPRGPPWATADSAASPSLAGAAQRARQLIHFDMAAIARAAGCSISAVVFGGLAGSEALPFSAEAYMDAIRAGAKSVDANLSGFRAGFQAARQNSDAPLPGITQFPTPTTSAGRELYTRVLSELPPSSRYLALEGARRLMDYQDEKYAATYLNQLARVRAVDDGRDDWLLTRGTARHLVFWMTYEDTIRVADLKIRAARVARVRQDVRADARELVGITEFMHPRFREACETLPRTLGAKLLGSPAANRLLGRFFVKGRFVETTSLSGFLLLSLIAALRRWRPTTLRHAEEQQRIGSWLELAIMAARRDTEAAVEIIRCQRLIKGYGATFERGLENFNLLLDRYRASPDSPRIASTLRDTRDKMLAATEERLSPAQ